MCFVYIQIYLVFSCIIMDRKTFWLHVLTALLVVGYTTLIVFTAIHNIWIFVFFAVHWYISVFFQSFFHHRYAAHAMFVMKKWWERVFHFFSWVTQGTSYLVPSAYAVLHRMHHKYSDTPQDPHSPIFFKDVFGMMRRTAKIYQAILKKKEYVKDFAQNYPTWTRLDKRWQSWISRIGRGIFYIGIYLLLGAQWWMFLLLPVHFLMSPVHGAIVNWAGHMLGYINHKDTWDHSRNTLPIDILTVWELFQNNHHNDGLNPKFANKWREVDPTYVVMKVLSWLRIIRFMK